MAVNCLDNVGHCFLTLAAMLCKDEKGLWTALDCYPDSEAFFFQFFASSMLVKGASGYAPTGTNYPFELSAAASAARPGSSPSLKYQKTL
jgi:hypothetical protein